MNDPQYLISKVYQLMEPFTDEPGILAWEYFNEAPGLEWIFESPADTTPDFGRVANFFITCNNIVTDEDISQNPGVIETMVDKHLINSGMWVHHYAGWRGTSSAPDKEPMTKILYSDNLLKNTTFCRYEDFIDWHSYGTEAYPLYPDHPEYSLNIETHLKAYKDVGYNDETCPPIIFGEINPWEYVKLYDENTVVSSDFNGFERTLYKNNNPQRNCIWEIYEIGYNSIIPDQVLQYEIQSLDLDPSFLRLNEHYKIWRDWSLGFSSLQHVPENGSGKIGHCFWILTNYNGSFIQFHDPEHGIYYDPAIRDGNGNITSYQPGTGGRMNWHNIYLNEDAIYPFYTELFRWDWGAR